MASAVYVTFIGEKVGGFFYWRWGSRRSVADQPSLADGSGNYGNPSTRNATVVYVTGGAGYLGSVLVPALLDLDYQVSVVDRLLWPQSVSPVLDHPQLRFYEEDIAHPDVLPHVGRRGRGVHLASISKRPTCDLSPNLTIETNYLATQSLAHLSKTISVRQFVFASSCSVYGRSRQLHWTMANSARDADQTGKRTQPAGFVEHGFGVTSLRFATLFGLSPRMRFDLAVNTMTRRGLMGQPIFINGSGSQYGLLPTSAMSPTPSFSYCRPSRNRGRCPMLVAMI